MMLTLADLPEGWEIKAHSHVQWVFLDKYNNTKRIGIARYKGVPSEGWVEQYTSSSSWKVLLPYDEKLTHEEAVHWAVTMILLGEVERAWNVGQKD